MKNQLLWLDLLRGLSALAVCAGHLRGFLFVDFGDVVDPTLLDQVFYLVTGLGHQAVMVFFVLSGFFVGGSAATAWSAGYWSWKDYAIRRGVRLWIVLIPALCLTALWDSLGRMKVGNVGYDGSFQSVLSSGPAPDLLPDWLLSTFLGNVLFLQTILVSVFGTNGPLWSLANEGWYYMLFPLGLGAYYRSGIYRWTCLFTSTALLVLLPVNLVTDILIWLMGFVAWRLGKSGSFATISRHAIWFVVSGLAFTLSLIASKVGHFFGNDFMIGLTCALFVSSLAQKGGGTALLRKSSLAMAETSYTLYLTHFPLLAFLWFGFMPGQQFQPDLASYGLFAIGMLLVLSYAGLVWWCFERNTEHVRRYLTRQI